MDKIKAISVVLDKLGRDFLVKAVNHKYYKRTGVKGHYKYYYTEKEYNEAKGIKPESKKTNVKKENDKTIDFKIGDKVTFGIDKISKWDVDKIENGKISISRYNGLKGRNVKKIVTPEKISKYEPPKPKERTYEHGTIYYGKDAPGTSGTGIRPAIAAKKINGELVFMVGYEKNLIDAFKTNNQFKEKIVLPNNSGNEKTRTVLMFKNKKDAENHFEKIATETLNIKEDKTEWFDDNLKKFYGLSKETTPKEPEKSILNSDTDLKGNKKDTFMYDFDTFMKLPLKGQFDGQESYKGKKIFTYSWVVPANNKEGKTLIKIDLNTKKPLIETKPLILKQIISRELTNWQKPIQQSILDGKMTAKDAKTIIESVDLEVPKDILKQIE